MSALLPAEAALLEKLEAKIERGLATFAEVGRALTTIRDSRLYRETHDTFAAYLDQRWQISRARGYQLIDAASVVDAVSTSGRQTDGGQQGHGAAQRRHGTADAGVPTNERVARELAKDPDPADAWADVVAVNGNAPTAAQARAVVQERKLKDPASDKQIAYLTSLAPGAAPDGPISKKTASKRIDELQRHKYCTCTVCGSHWDRKTGRRL